MAAKRKPKRLKDTPEAQYARFLETALAVSASKQAQAFDEAFMAVALAKDAPKPVAKKRKART